MAYPLAKDMRDRVSFQRRATTTTPLGGSEGAWSTLIASRLVKLVPIKPYRKDAEAVMAGRLQAVKLYELFVRSDSVTSTVTCDDRAIDGRDPTRIYKIRFIEDMDRRGVWLMMQLELGAADG